MYASSLSDLGRKVERGHGCDGAVENCGVFMNNERMYTDMEQWSEIRRRVLVERGSVGLQEEVKQAQAFNLLASRAPCF
jgi:hypothetical protein